MGDQHPAKPDAPQASLRAELLGRLFAAQAEINALLMESDTAEVAGALRASLNDIQSIQQEVASAPANRLFAMKSEVQAQVRAVQAEGARIREAAATFKLHADQRLEEAQHASRKQVEEVMAGMRDFDPYLKFASADEAAAYRHREQTRRDYIDREHAKGTVVGDLNAAKAAKDQLLDAGSHGGDRHPDFARRLNALDDTTKELKSAAAQAQATPAPATPQKPDTLVRPEAEKPDDLALAMAALQSAGVTPASNAAANSALPARRATAEIRPA